MIKNVLLSVDFCVAYLKYKRTESSNFYSGEV